MADNEKKQVRFIRVHGRIVPIRVDVNVNSKAASNRGKQGSSGGSSDVTKAGLVVGTAGAAVAADAARTRRIYSRNGVTIDRKKFSLQPFQMDRLGDTLIMRDKLGKRMGRASWYRDGDKAGFSWLGVGKKFRGQGHSQTLSRVAAHEMKKSGAKRIWNHVVHPGSATVNLTKNDSFWKVQRIKADGDAILEHVTKGAALRNINFHRKTKGVFTSDIFRETLLKGRTIMPGIRKAHLTTGMKVKLAAGLTVAAAGFAAALWSSRRKD